MKWTGIPMRHPAGMPGVWSRGNDSSAARYDTIHPFGTVAAPDTVEVIPGETLTQGFVMETEGNTAWEAAPEPNDGMSWIYAGLLAIFVIVCLRMSRTRRYIAALISTITEVRRRNNLFDDTIRESSFLILADILWVLSAGVILYGALVRWQPLSVTVNAEPVSIALCMGVTAVYALLMDLTYYVVGAIFSDRHLSAMWVKGNRAVHALEAFLLLPVALVYLCVPQWSTITLYCGLGVIALGALVFICKGFRIFFSEITSWMLFLYYLCSIEIVPIVLAYTAAQKVCSVAI